MFPLCGKQATLDSRLEFQTGIRICSWKAPLLCDIKKRLDHAHVVPTSSLDFTADKVSLASSCHFVGGKSGRES